MMSAATAPAALVSSIQVVGMSATALALIAVKTRSVRGSVAVARPL